MQNREWNFIDKSKWGEGEWNEEPDKVQWTDEATGLFCLAVRHPDFGNWCGYVGVTAEHPFFGLSYSDCSRADAKERGKLPSDEEFPLSEIGPLKIYFEQRLICGNEHCDHTPEAILTAHGGITFANRCQEHRKGHGVCHVPDEGETDFVHWFGFDCAHAGDLIPGMFARLPAALKLTHKSGEVYRNLNYIKDQCASLAAQLAEISNSYSKKGETWKDS